MVVRSIVFVGFYVDVGFLIKYYSTRKLDVSPCVVGLEECP
ncbi:MAG: hypothetical protein QXI24_07260 [Acidilobaceae archaeon]